ncbi:MAG TPA: carbohydrate ABC transporter permease [Acidimicrobiia bacterium]
MRLLRGVRSWWVDVVALAVAAVVFLVPFAFIIMTAGKEQAEASALDFTLPADWRLWENLVEVLTARNGIVVTALKNSFILTLVSVALIVFVCSMVAFVQQRRRDKMSTFVSLLMIAGLIIPPAVVPTIFVLQGIGLFKTLFGLILIELAFAIPFAVIVLRAFIGTIPREIDEAAIIDGASPMTLFFKVIFPLIRPAVITVVVVSAVFIYNDFVNPLYFLPGDENATVQLTLFNFQSQFLSRWNLLFMDVLLITIPPLIMFIFFSRKIVSGLAAGAVKG